MKEKFNTQKKYKLHEIGPKKFQVEALRDFGTVKEGDLGGCIEHESNLSHDGDCWIFDFSYVCQEARVEDDAQVRGDCIISGSTVISGKAVLEGGIVIHGNSNIGGADYFSAPSPNKGDSLPQANP